MAQTQLWSTSQQGGANNAGTIFKLNNANIISYAHEFTGGLNGQQPMGNLCVVNNEYIYGTTVNGGINNNGICFKFNMNTSTLTKIHDFTDTSAYYSTNGLIKGTDGNLYGTAGFGGAFGGGVIFKIDPITDQYSVLHNFDMPSATVWEVINNK